MELAAISIGLIAFAINADIIRSGPNPVTVGAPRLPIEADTATAIRFAKYTGAVGAVDSDQRPPDPVAVELKLATELLAAAESASIAVEPALWA
jgi:hypothetical protein